MNGRRLPDGTDPMAFTPGDYAKWTAWEKPFFYAKAPNGLLATLSGHTITEHEDGTITASPSIIVKGGLEQWHGFLERGFWREV